MVGPNGGETIEITTPSALMFRRESCNVAKDAKIAILMYDKENNLYHFSGITGEDDRVPNNGMR